MNGILLIAVGSSPEIRNGYRAWAKNMILSIRTFSPDIPIQLLYDGDKPDLDADVYTDVTGICDTTHTGQYEPSELKLRLDKFTEFDKTLYLDVDGCIVKDISPLFDYEGFCTQATGEMTYSQGQKFMLWSKQSVIWEKYGLDKARVIPATNTSFILFDDKTDVFEKAYDLYISNPLKKQEMFSKWGKSHSQPDEFYINLSLGEFTNLRPIYFRTVINSEYMSLENIRVNFFGIGCFGGVNYNHSVIEKYYNHIIAECGGGYKYKYLIQKKFYELQRPKLQKEKT